MAKPVDVARGTRPKTPERTLLDAAIWVIVNAGYNEGEAEKSLKSLSVGIPFLDDLRAAILDIKPTALDGPFTFTPEHAQRLYPNCKVDIP